MPLTKHNDVLGQTPSLDVVPRLRPLQEDQQLWCYPETVKSQGPSDMTST